MKEFADDNFKFDENGKKLSKRVENTVGKGEIARYEQFLLFPQCFQKACFPGASKGVVVWEWVNSFKEKKKEKKIDQFYFCFMATASAPIHAFLDLVFTRTPYNVLPKPVASFPHNHCRNNEQE